jgi:hypothetical protein
MRKGEPVVLRQARAVGRDQECQDLTSDAAVQHCNGGPTHEGFSASEMRSVEADSPNIRDVCFQSAVRNERWQLAYELAIAVRVCPSFRPSHPNWPRTSCVDRVTETCSPDRQEALPAAAAESTQTSDAP